MIKKARLYNLLGLLSLVLLIISLFLRQEVVDIHISDTYYVFNFTQAFVFISIILLGLFFSYHFIWKDVISKRQVWLHLSFTFITTIILIALLYNASRAYEPNFSNWDFLETNNTLLVLTLLIYAAGQIGFQIYFIFKTVQKP